MTDDEFAVTQVNAAFYEAFCRQDMERMESVWASFHEVAVIHPGWPVVYGREKVLASWRGILESPSSPDIACTQVRVSIIGDAAFVICTEKLFTGDLIATNVFAREGDEWKLVHHQAGPTTSDDLSTASFN